MPLLTVRVGCRVCLKGRVLDLPWACLQETQTTKEDGGQIHFFPVLFDGKQLYDVMVERCGPSKTSSPQK